MPLDSPLDWAPNLDEAIDRQPLTVPPTMSLVAAIALLNQTHSHTCDLGKDPTDRPKHIRASCLLVVQDEELLGIVTERDLVRLAARSIDLTEVTIADVMIQPIITLPQKSVQDIFAALFLFRRYRIRHLPIIDERGKLVGVVSHESIRQILRPANLLRFRRVADVMTSQVIHASMTATVLQVAQLMAEHRVSCIVITQPDQESETNRPVGIITERDIVQLQAFQRDLSIALAQAVMSTPLFLLSPEDSLWIAHQEMQTRRVGRLVVSWNWGQGLGIVTQTNLLRVFDPMEMYGVIENLQQTIQQLEAKRSLGATPQIELNQPDRIEDNRDRYLTLLDSAHAEIEQMMADLNISAERRKFLLQSVLEKLDRLDRELRGHG